MPELPEVETARRRAEEQVLDHTITAVACDEPQLLRNTSPQGLGCALHGATIRSVDRTGKWVRLTTDARADALLHVGMTGSLRWHDDDADAHDLRDLLGGSRAELKSALMDQDKVAGIGNLLSDELCWQIRVHPATPCRDLGDVWVDLADALARCPQDQPDPR